jgi:hypothetical protein
MNMAIKYLYLDDEQTSKLESMIDNVCNQLDLEIEPKNPSEYEYDIDVFVSNLNESEGVILDWRLDVLPTDGIYFKFRAGTVAQEMRIRQAEGKLRSFPIVLWSTDEKLRNSYSSDTASHDLFDKRYYKDELSESGEKVGNELISLASGYQKITQSMESEQLTNQVLNIDEEKRRLLPTSFIGFLDQQSKMSVHEYARILLREVIKMPGVLINDEFLAAKFGIDKDNSPDWNVFLQILTPFKYSGVFGESWERWWWNLIDKGWWKKLNSKIPSLQSLNAEERVKFLKDITGLANLVPAKPIKEAYQTNFQTICQFYKKPLDPVDGVTIKEKEPFMWQEKRYLSIDAALQRLGEEEGIKPHPVEFERLRLIKESMINND